MSGWITGTLVKVEESEEMCGGCFAPKYERVRTEPVQAAEDREGPSDQTASRSPESPGEPTASANAASNIR